MFVIKYVSGLLLVLMGAMDCLTTVVGSLYFGAREINPLTGLRVARGIFQTPTMRRITTEEFWPGADKDSDADWLEHVKNTGSTTFHQTSTCMMGSHPMSVVDNELKVHGMEGLRVVDASVMPTVISGNTNAATIMIAEKASDLIRARLRATAKAA